MMIAKQQTIERVTRDLTEFFEAIDRREVFIEDLDEDLIERLRRVLRTLVH